MQIYHEITRIVMKFLESTMKLLKQLWILLQIWNLELWSQN